MTIPLTHQTMGDRQNLTQFGLLHLLVRILIHNHQVLEVPFFASYVASGSQADSHQVFAPSLHSPPINFHSSPVK
jgi:hypothetical protein